MHEVCCVGAVRLGGAVHEVCCVGAVRGGEGALCMRCVVWGQ